jgi:HK97 gp10 family phage protein
MADFLTGGKFKVNVNLKGQVKAAKRGATKAMKDAAKKLEKEIKAAAPVQVSKRTPYVDKYGRHGGALKKSVDVKAVGGENPRLEIRTHDYGLYVDQGTVNQPPNPFVTGTVRANRRAIVRGIAKQTAKEMKKASVKRTRRKR